MLAVRTTPMNATSKEEKKKSEALYKDYLSRQHTKAVNGIKSACNALNDVVCNSTDDEIDLIIGCGKIDGMFPCK